MRTDEEIEAQLDALVDSYSNDEEIYALRDIVYELLDDRRRKSAHELCVEQGVDRARLQAALDSKDRWGAMVHAFEFLTAVGAVLASWPSEFDNDEEVRVANGEHLGGDRG